jgi:hypothetical protein
MGDRTPDSVQTLSKPHSSETRVSCRQCGETFLPRLRGRNAAFCSGRCRARWHGARRSAVAGELVELLDRATALARELTKR